jgi:hypothetical protein
MTPLEHEDATAIVSITGLALGCYNNATQNYEVGFLRHDCHVLKIEVKKKLRRGESVMMYEIGDNEHRIFIDAVNCVTPQDPIYFVGDNYDNFNRTQQTGDLEDFRWVVDFDRNLNQGNPVEIQRPNVPVTEMYISKPRLYADKDSMSDDLYNLISLDAKGKPIPNIEPEPFGFFAEGIKADITCQNGGAVIFRVDGPQGFQVHLPHRYGPHEITITNICPPKAKSENGNTDDDAGTTGDPSVEVEPTDFRHYYLLIKDTAGKKYDVAPANEGEGAVCNGSTLGKSGSLFPLPGGTG